MSFKPSEGYDRLLAARPPGRQGFEAPPSTVSGSLVGAKITARNWRSEHRPSGSTDQSPAPFIEQRFNEPDRFMEWGQRYATTSMGMDFTPPPPPPPMEGEVVA